MSEAGDSFGVGSIAREIARARRGAPATGHAEDEACANCGVERIGAYCHACGQAGHLHRDAMALVHDIAHGVFHFEGRIWNTLPLLGWRPGELTRRYIDGERAKFVSPMALFLFSVFLMFAVVSNLGHRHRPEIATDRTAAAELAGERQALAVRIAALRRQRAATADAGAARAIDARIAAADDDLRALQVPGRVRALIGGRIEGGETASGTATIAADAADRARFAREGFGTGIGWFDATIAHAARNPELTTYKLKSYGYKYSWALIPLSVPFVWLLFCLRRDVGFYDHAIFTIYSLAFLSLAIVALALLGWIGVPGGWLWTAALAIPPIHLYRQLKGTYGLGRFGAAWRTAALLAIGTLTMTLFVAFLVWMGSD